MDKRGQCIGTKMNEMKGFRINEVYKKFDILEKRGVVNRDEGSKKDEEQ